MTLSLVEEIRIVQPQYLRYAYVHRFLEYIHKSAAKAYSRLNVEQSWLIFRVAMQMAFETNLPSYIRTRCPKFSPVCMH